MTALLSVSDLRVGFVGEDRIASRAVDGVALSVAPGAALGSVGESGCGKTVTALAAMGLLRDVPTARVSGTIEFEGRDLVSCPVAELRSVQGSRIAMVFQDPLSSLHPLKRVGDQVA